MGAKNILPFLVLLFGLSASAQKTIKIWEGTDMSRKQKRSELTVFLPEKADASGISVIICPGGSYRYLGMKREGYDIAGWLNRQGIAAFVLRYRVGRQGNHYPAMIQDLQRAMQLVKESSEKYDIDPDKVGVMGFSAGGHLAGTAATYFDFNFMDSLGIAPQVSMRPAFAAMIYPVVSMEDSLAHKKSRVNLLTKTPSPALVRKMSLEQNVHPDMPPVFLVQCKGDQTVNYLNASCYHEALTEKSIEHYYRLYNEPGHGFGINPGKGKGDAPLWNLDFIPWLESTLQIRLSNNTQMQSSNLQNR